MTEMHAAAPLSGSGALMPAGAQGFATAAPWPVAPEAILLVPNNRNSEIDATLALMLAAATQGQSDWLSSDHSYSASPASPHRKLSSLQPAAPTLPASHADPSSSSWMNCEMGEWHADAESWLMAAPKPASSSDCEVLPLPRLSSEQLKLVRESQQQQAQQQRHWKPSAGATAGGSAGSSPASRRVSLAQPSRGATPTASRAASARPTQQRFSTASTPTGQQQQQQQLSERRQSTASLAVPTARRAILSSPRPATAAASPPKQLWSPSGAKAGSKAPTSARTSRAGGPTGQAARLFTTGPAPAQRQAPLKVQSAAQPQAPTKSALAVGELPPAVKVAAWLHSPSGPTASGPVSRLPTNESIAGGSGTLKVRKGSAAANLLAAQASPHASSDGGSTWRIGVLPMQAAVPAAAAAAASAATSAGGFTSRIPRPATTGAMPAASGSSRGTADGTAHMGTAHRSELALKQLAHRALAAGSSGSSSPAPRAVHTRRPSSLLGFGSGEERAVASAENSPSASPTRRSIHVPAPRSVAASESRCSSAGSVPSTPRSTHLLSSTSFSPAASPTAQLSATGPRSGATSSSSSPGCPHLLEAQALAASSLAAAQANARQAAAECALLARASPAAWEAAQTVAAAAAASSCSSQAGGSCSVLEQQLAQLERLSRCLSEASSSVSELCFMEAVAKSRRPSNSSRGAAQHSLPTSRPGSQPGSTGSSSQAGANC